ncbi:unnamed protein product [[Actinomadura] parvosata subsp. kistnae]|nr:unnamed protein product [Actinomadura parvosata subsp. kistnae]
MSRASGLGMPSSIAPVPGKFSENVGEFRTKCPISNTSRTCPSRNRS